MCDLRGSRSIGVAVGALVAILGALIPLTEWWGLRSNILPIPGAIAAGIGAVIAGYWVAPLADPRSRRALGGVAFRFGLASFALSLPTILIDAVIVSSRPLDEGWPVTLGPFLGGILGTFILAPAVAVFAFVAAPIWTLLVRLALEVLVRRSAVHDGDRAGPRA
jgi:hypothetical protein